MTRKYLTTHLLAWVVGIGAIGCAGDEDVQLIPLTQGSGGAQAAGGAGKGGSAGSTGNGGTTTGGGGTPTTTGGGGSGGSTSTTGGGGTVTTTGAGGSAGRGGSGGTTATGGTGGTTATGGAGGTAGRGGAGGTTATGGTAGTTATGQGGTAGSTTCGSLGNANNGSGSFTFYFFGQGTPKMGPGGTFLTACGYFGTESGQTDTVTSIANTAPASNTYFAAIPGASGSNFSTVNSCGACVQITNGGKSIIATIIDECPQDSNPPCQSNPNGHLDLSVAAFNALGYSVGNPSGTTWSYVPCPVSGNVTTRIKSGNTDQLFIENSILAITGVTMNGAAGTHLNYGAWSFNGRAVAGQTLVLTDRANRTLSVVVNGSADQTVDTGKQFPRCQ